MSPLDAARQLLEILGEYGPRDSWELPYSGSECAVCDVEGPGHRPDCPWISMPGIVAVLEAAERFVAAVQADKGSGPIPGSMGGSYVDFKRGIAYQHELREAQEALVAALKGEQD